MSNALELVVSTIQKFLLEASPSDADIFPGSNSHLLLLIFSQLQRTHMLLEEYSKELVLDWHGLIYDELYRVVTRISTLVRYPGDISIPVEAREEQFLETLLDLRWWTWVLALQVGTLQTNPTLYIVYLGTHEGVLDVKVSSLPWSGDAVSRHLPSYSFELWQQGREGRLREILQSESGADRLRDHGQNEADMLLTDVRNIHAELLDFKIKQLGPTKFRDAGKPSSIGDYLPIDLTEDLLGASSTGYVVRTTCSNGQGGSISCALKRIDTMDDKPPDLARLWHPHVVHLLHHWREKSGLHCKDRERMPSSPFMTFLVMELLDGDLVKLMTRTKKAGVSPFSLLVAVDLMLQIAKGMLYLHEMGVSHPHLKCDNVLFRAENKTHPAFQVGDVRVKLGGFGCSRMANVETKNRDVFCFGLTCLEILTGDGWSEDIYGADRVPKPIIPEMTPPILKHCISSCLSINLTFSEVVMLLLLAQCHIMQTCNNETMLCTGSLHINEVETNIQDLVSSSTSRGGLNEVFHVHQLHPQVGEVSTSVQITLIFFHGFPKVSEEWRMTWMTRDNKLVWPQNWLPEDLDGDIRVLSVSFDDHLNVSSHQTIENLLQILILSGTWKLGGIEQAIVLVGHSFGGVLIKSLVTEAQKLAEKTVVYSDDFKEVMKCKKFLKRLASIVFYSVPHALTNTEFENYISGCSNTRVLQRSSLLKSLRKDDSFIPKMIQLSRDFESAVPHKTKVLAFVEGKPMSKKCFLVSENSREGQSLSWEWHRVDKDNHFEVCRPDSKSHTGYKILLNHLLEMCVMFTYDCTSPTTNVRRQSWKVIGTVVIAICKFKKLLDKRSTNLSERFAIHSSKSLLEWSGDGSWTSSTGSPFVSDSHFGNKSEIFEKVGASTLMNELITKLSSWKTELPQDAANTIRCLTKMNSENRLRIAEEGGIPFLINLLRSPDKMTQEHAITALMNLSLQESNRGLIMKAGAIDGIVHVVKWGQSMEARENAAATIQCLSYENENKISIGNTEAIPALVELLHNGTRQGKKDAANALCNLVSFQAGNKRRAVQTGLISVLMDILHDHSTNELDDISLSILTNLSLYPGGLVHIGNTEPVGTLIDIITCGSHKGQELATALLCKLCSDDRSFIEAANHCGATSPLKALLRNDKLTTSRCKLKAEQLLDLLTSEDISY